MEEIQSKLGTNIKMPPGYYITYGGQFQNLVEANKRLSIAVPFALALIFVLLFFTFRSFKHSILIFTAIPLSAIGGIFALWLRGMPFSISAGVGFIALFGVAVLNGIVLIGYFNQLKEEGMTDIMERIREGTKVRLRPVIMTAAVASLGFLPMALSNGAGAEVQKPLATVVIGGLISATLLTLILLPILYFIFEEKIKGRKIKSLPISMLFLFGVSFQMNAQTSTKITLPQALDLAYKNNQMLQSSSYDVQSKQSLQKSYKIFPKTNFNAQLGQFNSKQFDQYYSVSQDIPNPALFKAKKKVGEQNVTLSEQRLNITKQELTYNIKQSWYQYLYLKEVSKVLTREDSLLREFVKGASLKFKTGESTLLEKMTAENRQQQLRQDLVQTTNLMEAERIKLEQMISPNAALTLEESSLPSLDFSELIESNVLQKNPYLIYSMQKITLAEAEQKVIKAEAKPDFSVGYFIQSISGVQDVDGSLVNYDNSPRFQGVQLGISFPVFGRSGNKARNDAAKTQVLMQQKEQEYLQSHLQSELQQYTNEYNFWKNKVAFYQNNALPNAKSIVTNATRAYQSGDIGYVEYAQALQTNLDTQKGYLEAINSMNQMVITIQFSINQ